MEADSFDDEDFHPAGCTYLNEEGEEWLSTWTYSYPVYEYSDNRLIVPRICYPTYYLDMYSYSQDKIEYLGYASTDKRFLFADSSGIYLEESKDDISVVLGKYSIVSYHELEEKRGWSVSSFLPNETSERRTVRSKKLEPSTTSKPQKVKSRQYISNLDTFKMLSSDSCDYLLLDSLTYEKHHVILFSRPQDCGLKTTLEEAQKIR
ncbi:hypothetical protein GF359_00295 [candidate division WOR-3 bacterium]|uniref:Uncharacterized protein n=1 Tax=candidate division WOR-3 bacterium TaxID=2052148 RepID=A0A9D5K7D8_UNCW3|nr:hypothetical protein [candidate division WOR-3 bacterium]MBD3363632.1 hypothetical protein [candidate division WOR-3 bacterium]